MTYNKQVQAYKDASHMVRKTKQVVMLYEGAIRNVQQAKQAIADGDIQLRYDSLNKACAIINGLQLSLDMTQGEVAQLLFDYYSGIDMRLMSVHQSNDASLCDASVRHLKMMRDAWQEIDENIDKDKITTQPNSYQDDSHSLSGYSQTPESAIPTEGYSATTKQETMCLSC